MAPSSTLVAAPRAAHNLAPMKTTIFGNSLPSNSQRRSTSGSPTKRPLYNDENTDPNGLSNPKRVKSVLQSTALTVKSLNEHPKQSTVSSSGKQSSRFVLTDKQPLQQQQQKRGALGNITNNHHRVEKSSSKPRIGSSLKNVISNASPPRRSRNSPPRTAREMRRQRAPFAVHVDPPVFDSPSMGSIDSVIREAAPARSRSNSLVTPKNEVTEPSALLPTSIPDSWVFAIYEDTPEETMQNMMEHSTNTLDLSDDEGSKSELSELGKENIPPSRLAELMATAPEERGEQMRVDVAEKSIPQRTPERRTLGELRAPLEEMEAAELENDDKEESKVPTLEKEGFMTVTTPEKKKMPVVSKGKGALGWTVYKDVSELPPAPPVELKGLGIKGLGTKMGKSVVFKESGGDGTKKRALSEI